MDLLINVAPDLQCVVEQDIRITYHALPLSNDRNQKNEKRHSCELLV